jgi:hypothetical protein
LHIAWLQSSAVMRSPACQFLPYRWVQIGGRAQISDRSISGHGPCSPRVRFGEYDREVAAVLARKVVALDERHRRNTISFITPRPGR